jgi:dTMP kinase
MTQVQFYGYGIPGFTKKRLPGKLIVLEGTDGVGRSTQIALLREWLESKGYAATATGLKRGDLAGKAIQMAMDGHTLGDTTMNLSYATDFADRLERDILPSLRAGFVVLLDRYIYSIFARAQVRGADPAWIRSVLGFALVPDIVFYLQADIAHLIPRVLNARGFRYWESGVDFLKGRDYYDSYVEYQTRLIAQFDAMSDEFDFMRIDANEGIHNVFVVLKKEINSLIKEMKPPKRKAVEKRFAKVVGEKEKEDLKAKPKQDGKDSIEEKTKGAEKSKTKKEAEVDKSAKPKQDGKDTIEEKPKGAEKVKAKKEAEVDKSAKSKQDGKDTIEEKPKGAEKVKAKKEAEVDKSAKSPHDPAEVSDKETGTKDQA